MGPRMGDGEHAEKLCQVAGSCQLSRTKLVQMPTAFIGGRIPCTHVIMRTTSCLQRLDYK